MSADGWFRACMACVGAVWVACWSGAPDWLLGSALAALIVTTIGAMCAPVGRRRGDRRHP